MKIQERLANQIKFDMWSDAVTSGLNSLGISQDTRNLAQPVIDQAKNLIPKGGAIPNPQVLGMNGSNAIPTAPTPIQTLMRVKVSGIPVVPVAVALIILIVVLKGHK